MKLLPLLSLIANVNATVAQLWKIEAQNPNLWSSFFGAIQNLYFVPRSCQDIKNKQTNKKNKKKGKDNSPWDNYYYSIFQTRLIRRIKLHCVLSHYLGEGMWA